MFSVPFIVSHMKVQIPRPYANECPLLALCREKNATLIEPFSTVYSVFDIFV